MRFSRANELRVDDSKPASARRLASRFQCLEIVELAVVLNDDELSAAGVGNAVRFTEFVQHPRAFDAQSRLQRPGGIVDARMNHLTVMSARAHAWAWFALENADAVTTLGYRPRSCESDDPGADDRDIDV
jgi:hypothetical protein